MLWFDFHVFRDALGIPSYFHNACVFPMGVTKLAVDQLGRWISVPWEFWKPQSWSKQLRQMCIFQQFKNEIIYFWKFPTVRVGACTFRPFNFQKNQKSKIKNGNNYFRLLNSRKTKMKSKFLIFVLFNQNENLKWVYHADFLFLELNQNRKSTRIYLKSIHVKNKLWFPFLFWWNGSKIHHMATGKSEIKKHISIFIFDEKSKIEIDKKEHTGEGREGRNFAMLGSATK